MMAEHTESQLNKEFNPFSYFCIVQTCYATLQKKICEPEKLNKIYKLYQQSRLTKNINQTQKLKNLLITQMNTHSPIIEEYLQSVKENEEDEETKPEAWHKLSIGILAWELE